MIVPGTVALGLSVVTVSGGLLDLSVGVTVTGSSIVTATMVRGGWAPAIAALAAICFGIGVGCFNAVLVAGIGLNPIVATLATAFAGGGIISVLTTTIQETVPIDSGLAVFGRETLLGIPISLLVVAALMAATECFLVKSRPGRHMVALGGNADAVTARGISVRQLRTASFVICGALAATGGVFLAAENSWLSNTADPQLAYQVAAIVLLGGISIAGGRGRIAGLLFSLLLLSTVPTALVQFGASSAWQDVLSGAALFIAVCLDARRIRRHR
jgi:ribose/xylose/arabinose/galactoside ABC-type transport system permease subunit